MALPKQVKKPEPFPEGSSREHLTDQHGNKIPNPILNTVIPKKIKEPEPMLALPVVKPSKEEPILEKGAGAPLEHLAKDTLDNVATGADEILRGVAHKSIESFAGIIRKNKTGQPDSA